MLKRKFLVVMSITVICFTIGARFLPTTITPSAHAQTYYATKAEAVAQVPLHVVPKDCFVWKDGTDPNFPWRVIPGDGPGGLGTGCAHWVAHQLGIEEGLGCYVGRSIRVSDVIRGRIQRANIGAAQVGDIWTSTSGGHCGIVRQVDTESSPARVEVENCSSNFDQTGGVGFTWYNTGRIYAAVGSSGAPAPGNTNPSEPRDTHR